VPRCGIRPPVKRGSRAAGHAVWRACVFSASTTFAAISASRCSVATLKAPSNPARMTGARRGMSLSMGGNPPLLAAPSASSIWDRTREHASLGRRRTPSGFSLLSGARCPSGQLLLLVRAMHGSLLAWSGGNSTEPREAKPQTKSVVLTWLLFIGPRPSPGTTATPVPTGAACRLFALTTWRPADSGGYMARRMAGRTLWVRLPTRVERIWRNPAAADISESSMHSMAPPRRLYAGCSG